MTYIFVSISLILSILLIIIGLRYYRINKTFSGRFQKLKSETDIKVLDLEAEIQRQKYIIENYKGKINFSANSYSDSKIPDYSEINANITVNETVRDIVSEKIQLEREAEKFKQKNKKLWEQSIAVHKEKERIDGIKQEIETRHKEITDSINYARRIQTALLPPSDYLDQILNNYFILYRPRNVVSGDFYWIKKMENKILIAVADCTGHGVPGAFVSMLGVSFLNEITAANASVTAVEVLENMRIMVKKALRQAEDKNSPHDGMDMVICIFDTKLNELEFAGANNDIFLLRNNKVIELKGVKSPISVYLKERPFLSETIKLQSKDSIFMFSDGFVDQFGGSQGRKIRKSTFIELLENYAAKQLSIKQIETELSNYLTNWMGDKYAQVDDILVVGVELE